MRAPVTTRGGGSGDYSMRSAAGAAGACLWQRHGGTRTPAGGQTTLLAPLVAFGGLGYE